jgi:hypothetical protein
MIVCIRMDDLLCALQNFQSGSALTCSDTGGKACPMVGMFGMRNFRYRYTEKIIPILSVYRFSFYNYKGKFFNGNVKEILSNSKREKDNFVFEAVSNMFRTTHTQCKISLKWKF